MRHGLLVLLCAALAACAPVPTTSDGAAAQDSFQDRNIEQQAIARINERYKGSIYVNVTSFNRHVLLTGAAPSEGDRSAIAQIAAAIPDVRLVSNEMAVGDDAGMTVRGSDIFVTSDVKLRFLKHGNFHADQVRVVTVNGTVYLLGQVTRGQAGAAADLASTTKGVRRVITLFEYTN